MIDLSHLDMLQIARTLGYLGIIGILFAETGLFFGFFLPGDSLLFTAGLLASQHFFNIFILFPSMLLASILGYSLSYWVGAKMGNWLIHRPDSIWFKKRYLDEAKQFYNRHGGKALILGRLLPVIRTFVPLVAGMTFLPFRKYNLYNILGAIFWVGGLTFLGFFIGQAFPKAYDYIYPMVAMIIIISLLPSLWHLLQACRNKKRIDLF